jgi:anti-anti-sigma factor
MDVRVEAAVGGSILRPVGRLDGPGAKRFRQSVSELCGVRPQPLAVVLDEVTALLATGAEALLWLVRRQRAAAAPLALVHSQPAESVMLRAAGLTALVPTMTSVAEARAWLATHERREA